MGAVRTLSYDAIIIGGGAAGLYCALHAGRRGKRVLVIEHNTEVGAKILISGGGRCNFTNLGVSPERFISANPHFARSALARHTQHDFIALIEKHGIPYYEKTLGQLFCEGARSSRRIVQMLLDECAAAGVAIRIACQVKEITHAGQFRVETSQGPFESGALVVATGGLAIPKLGATGFAFDVAKQFNIPVIETRPALVPLTFGEADLAWMKPLAGSRRTSRRVRARPLFAKRRCSRIADSPVRPFCKSRPTGVPARPSRSTGCQMRRRTCSPNASASGPRRN